MNLQKFIFLVLFLSISTFSTATTWNEPWQEKVIKESDYFVFAKVLSFDEEKGVTIDIIKSLGGEKISGKIKITDFNLLDLCSRSGGHGPEFHFKNVDSCYFFLKKIKDTISIATPTSGFSPASEGKVFGTYRHSYHQAAVPQEIYERTMTAIFNHYHGLSYDATFINDYVKKYLSLKPAGFKNEEIETFFGQHVALETIYHLKLQNYYNLIIPFLNDKSNFHNQVSAARALISCNTTECKNALIDLVKEKEAREFVKVIAIWTLQEFKPNELKDKLIQLDKDASDKSEGFGGNIMDPRVCTSVPSPKKALSELIKSL